MTSTSTMTAVTPKITSEFYLLVDKDVAGVFFGYLSGDCQVLVTK